MSAIRVLIVDDAAVVRRILAEALAGVPDIEVAAQAANGREAITQIARCRPDLVTLDVEMPEMGGLATLAEIRRQWPDLPVIMCASPTVDSAQQTIEALERGAKDFITKPQAANLRQAIAGLREELVPLIRTHARRLPPAPVLPPVPAAPPPAAAPRPPPVAPRPVPAAPPPPPAATGIGSGSRPALLRPAPPPVQAGAGSGLRPGVRPALGGSRIEAVVIGVSTGGPNALAELVPALPGDLPVPVLIVQHMPPVFTRLLAERLAGRSRLRVVEATAGQPVTAGTVWIAPGDHHLVVRSEGGRTVTALNQQPSENSCRPAVDPLFRSAADAWGRSVLAVILTGMGSDGMKGCQRLKEVGASVLIQDEATSVVWGMPGAVHRAGLHDRCLPLAQIADEIARRAREGRVGRL